MLLSDTTILHSSGTSSGFQYLEFSPDPALLPFIRCFWYFCGLPKARFRKEQRFLPDGTADLSFNLGEPFQQAIDGSPPVTIRSGWITGPCTSTITTFMTPPVQMIGVSFHPGGLHPFLKIPAVELKNRCIELEMLIPKNHVGELFTGAVQGAGLQQQFRGLNRYFLNRLEKIEWDMTTSKALKRLYNSCGKINATGLAADSGVSLRSLQRKFREFVGLSPKKLAKLIRFRHAYRLLTRIKRPSLSEVAYMAGYYDQAHFSNEFGQLIGTSPMRLLSDDTAHHNYMLLRNHSHYRSGV